MNETPGIFEAISLLARWADPYVREIKAGTVHEGHDGWGQRSDTGPLRFHCSCGEDIDEAVRDRLDRL